MAQPSEPPAIEAVMRGDAGALGRLLEFHQHRLYNVCYRMLGHRDDAAEVAQEAMLKIVEHIHDFNGQSEITTWMVRIAMNLSISHLRKRKLRHTTSLDSGGGGDPDDQSTALRHELKDHREPSPGSSVEQQETAAQLQVALARIEEDFRSILILRDLEGMDYQHIADVLALPVGTVKSRLFRARLALRHEMLRLNPPPASAPPDGVAKEVGHG
ncbi:MAG: sigma-70 family RNA polymerase sigma factor [Planctomycetota bacterium]|nr:sigma-70 family RNA polymerase sigma factor [Planctomycetota bacterium]